MARRRLGPLLFGLLLLASSPAASAESFTWTGFYAGGSAGVGFGGSSTFVDLEGFNYFAANPAPGEVTKVGTDASFIGGAQIGYNQAFGRLVAGIEADISGFDFHAEKTPASSKQDWGSDTYVSVEMEWLATLRGRVGIAAGAGSSTARPASPSPTANSAITISAIPCRLAAAA